jgi:hypothetical protein
VNPKAETVEQSPGAQHTVVPGNAASQIGKRIWRVGYNEKNGIPSDRNDLGDHITVDRGILVEKA